MLLLFQLSLVETIIVIKVQFFIHCTNFFGNYNFLKILKINKFSIAEEPSPIGILQMKIFWKKRKVKVQKYDDENLQL